MGYAFAYSNQRQGEKKMESYVLIHSWSDDKNGISNEMELLGIFAKISETREAMYKA